MPAETMPAPEPVLQHAVEQRAVPLTDVEIRDESGAGSEFFTMVGHAAIFNSLSDDLGGFREIIEPGAFRDAVARSRVHLLWNHDTNYALASTDSRTLELREDEQGLRVWARIPRSLTYAQDIRELFRHGIARDMSFAFSMPADGSGEEWRTNDDGSITRTLTRVSELFDVSAVTRGAYAAPSFAMRALERAAAQGRVPTESGAGHENVSPGDSPEGTTTVAPELSPAGGDPERQRMAALKARARLALSTLPERGSNALAR